MSLVLRGKSSADWQSCDFVSWLLDSTRQAEWHERLPSVDDVLCDWKLSDLCGPCKWKRLFATDTTPQQELHEKAFWECDRNTSLHSATSDTKSSRDTVLTVWNRRSSLVILKQHVFTKRLWSALLNITSFKYQLIIYICSSLIISDYDIK